MKKIKNRIAVFFQKQLREIKRKNAEHNQLNFNYSQLSNMFPAPFFIPNTRWSISPSTILHVLNEIIISEKKCVIEFGSGNSTLFIAKLIAINKLDVKFYSVESNAVWAAKIRKELERYDLNNFVSILEVPTTEIEEKYKFKNQSKWYSIPILTDKLAGVEKIDLVLVDAPEKKLSPYSRYSAIPFLKDRLTKNCTVFIDDSDRTDEKEIVLAWSQLLNLEPRTIERYTYFQNKESFNSIPFQLE